MAPTKMQYGTCRCVSKARELSPQIDDIYLQLEPYSTPWYIRAQSVEDYPWLYVLRPAHLVPVASSRGGGYQAHQGSVSHLRIQVNAV